MAPCGRPQSTLVLPPFCGVLAALLRACSATAGRAPVEQVQLLAGTELSGSLSNGNTLPQVKRPWGFNDWAPHTVGDLHDNPWWFSRSSTSFRGLKCSHQPSPWLGDWGYFSIMPNIGDTQPLRTSPDEDAVSAVEDATGEPSVFRSATPWLQYSPDESTWKPYLFSTSLGKAGSSERITFEFTPTSHAGAGRVVFPPGSTEDGAVEVRVPKGLTITRGRRLSGYTATAGGRVPDGFRLYFVMDFSRPPVRVDDSAGCSPGSGGCSLTRLVFGPDAGTVEFGVATSLISVEQASQNLAQQVSDRNFEEVVEEGRHVWSQALGRVSVEMQDDEQHKIFYTNLWKSMLFPRFLQEKNIHGNEVHYSPFNGRVQSGKLVVDSGFWDAYHTVYPLNSIVFPENLGHMIDGWVNAYKENGWIPQWASPGIRDSMMGTMSDVSIADAIVKSEAGGFSFDLKTAYEAIRKDATESPAEGDKAGGRKGLKEYIKSGFVAEGFSGSRSNSASGGNTESVARSLNHAVADAAVARAAEALGHTSDAKTLSERSKLAGNILFNRKTKFFQPRDAKGEFVQGFEPLAWRRGFTEGSAYHYRFYLPHDVELLQDFHNGNLCNAIKEDLEHTNGPAYFAGGYGDNIHEMREHEAVQKDFGMYNHCNQPAHEVLWVAKKAGCDELADKYLRRVMDKLYTTEGWCGDEDNGEMSSWYVLSALGIYSLQGAKDEMVLGSPAVTRASVRLPGDRGNLTVVAENQGSKHVYVQSVTWTPTGGSPEVVVGNIIKYSALMSGGELKFTMGAFPRAVGLFRRLRSGGPPRQAA